MNPNDFEDDYEENIESADSSYIEDVKKKDLESDPSVGNIIGFINERFSKAEDARRVDEDRWMKSYRNYRGLYSPDVQFTEAERSRVFVKVTKTKTLAAYGQIVDVLFGNNKFPINVDPTTLPEGVAESVHFNLDPAADEAVDELKQTFSPFSTEEAKLQPGETMQQLSERLGGMANKLEPVMDKLVEGPGTTPSTVTVRPAQVAAKKMQKKIHDQLEESGANKQLRLAAFECALFGTGIMKGPFATNKEYPRWDDEGNYDPVIKTVPSTSNVSIWDFYPDPDAANMDEAEYIIERHKMSRSQLRALKGRPFFRDNSIDTAIKLGESYEKKWWEQVMEDDEQGSKAERYEVKEFWGFVDREVLEDHDLKIPSELKDSEQVNVNLWSCNGQVIRMVMNPFKPALIPYYAVPYEINPYSFFGVGIAENMDDTQTLMNGFMRMAVDNAVLSGNLLIEVDETNLVPGQDLSVYPGKVFRRQGGAPGQAIFGTKFPNVSGENMQLFDKARVLSDESTGFPSFAHGQTGVSGVGRTASGISMLMSAANGSIRTVIKNVDDYLLNPLGKAFFSFNMQFDYDPSIKGDLDVKAQGTASLMANEVRSQRLMQFLQVAQNPTLAPFAKMDYIIREIAISMDLDPDKVTNSMDDAAIQAEILKGFQAPPEPTDPNAPPTAPQGQAPQGQAPTGPQDMTGGGGGNIGVGAAATPGEPGFSGNVQ
tara:strand:+ start:5011 stop:7146 length:2136 start_codon:yes stop_codon:yes gene_type:complete